MKLLLLLLACVAASNAVSYTYDYWCAHNFAVYPSTCSYHYCVYFPETWCSCDYYDPILLAYPSDTEYCINHWHCWSETPVSTLVGRIADLLSGEATRMCDEMYAHRDQFFAELDALHDQFKADMENYLSQWYSYRYECNGIVYVGDYSFEMQERIQEYCEQLDDIRAEVWDSYEEAISDKIDVLTEYHDSILERAETCLTTRLQKIAEYEVTLDEKIEEYVAKFTEYHFAIAEKNMKGYEKLFRKLICSETWLAEIKVWLMTAWYWQQQCDLIYVLADEYRANITSYKYQLLIYYTCSYVCAFGTCGLTFNQQCYTDSCKKLGCWYGYKSDYKCVRFALAPFKYKMKFPKYHCLETCDVDSVVGSVDGVIADLRQKMETALAERDAQYQEWRDLWVGYHEQYKAAFEDIVTIRHDWYCSYMQKYVYTDCHGYISIVDQAALEELKQSLLDQAAEVCENYNDQLDESLEAADEAHEESQQQFRDNVETLIGEVERMFEECKSKRLDAIENYRVKLVASVEKKRSKLIKKLDKAKAKHLEKFVKMLKFYHGDNVFDYWLPGAVYNCYGWAFLDERYYEYLHDFDCFWDPMIPRLVENYACKYTCDAETKCLPTYHCGGFYEWHFCLPDPSIYCFQYQLWLKFYCA